MALLIAPNILDTVKILFINKNAPMEMASSLNALISQIFLSFLLNHILLSNSSQKENHVVYEF